MVLQEERKMQMEEVSGIGTPEVHSMPSINVANIANHPGASK